MLKTAVLRLFATAVVVALAFLLFTVERATANGSTDRACAVPPSAAATPIEVPQTIEPSKAAPPSTTKLGTTQTMEVSGYTSEAGQTDSRPCEAADQSDICRRKAKGELICASNAFPLGTRIHVKGLGPCTVADRMNSRYANRVDWYYGQDAEGSSLKKQRALEIGVRKRTVRVLSIPE